MRFVPLKASTAESISLAVSKNPNCVSLIRQFIRLYRFNTRTVPACRLSLDVPLFDTKEKKRANVETIVSGILCGMTSDVERKKFLFFFETVSLHAGTIIEERKLKMRLQNYSPGREEKRTAILSCGDYTVLAEFAAGELNKMMEAPGSTTRQ